MKILFFSSYFYPYTSGITTYPFKILSHLAKKNNVTVLTFPHNEGLKNEQKLNKIKIIRLPYFFRVSKGFISPQSLIFFLNEAKKTDLIILNIPNFEGLFLAVIGKLLKKKVISIFHCQVFLPKDPLNHLVEFFLNLSVYIQLKLSQQIVAYTKDYSQSISLGKKFIKKTVFLLPPIEKTISDKNLLKKFLKQKDQTIWVGFSGRIAQEKGIEHLIGAFKKLSYKNKELIFAGPYGKQVVGEEEYYLEVKKILNKEHIKYRFLGNLNTNQLSAFYEAIDILVLPSVNQTEAFGMVQPEAMLCGKPVVVSNLPGVRIPVTLTKMGVIVSPKNTNALAEALEKILKNRNQYANITLVKKAKTIFKIDKTYAFYTNLISNL